MGKADRIKQARQAQEPQIMGTVSIDILDDGNVKVSGPIQDPAFVVGLMGKVMSALANFYVKQKEGPQIIKPTPGMFLPKNN